MDKSSSMHTSGCERNVSGRACARPYVALHENGNEGCLLLDLSTVWSPLAEKQPAWQYQAKCLSWSLSWPSRLAESRSWYLSLGTQARCTPTDSYTGDNRNTTLPVVNARCTANQALTARGHLMAWC